MNWKRWKLGVITALLLSLFVAGAGLTAGMDWRAFVAVFCSAAITHFGSFIKDHPPTEINFDENQKEKEK